MSKGEGLYPAPTNQRINDLDARISNMQKGTRALIPGVVPLHDILRQKFRWYKRWSSWPLSKTVNFLVLFIYIAGASYFSINGLINSNRVLAATTGCTWTNGHSTGIWNDAANWSCGTVPDNTSDVIFNGAVSNADITIDVAATAGSFTVNDATGGGGGVAGQATAENTGNHLNFSTNGANVAVSGAGVFSGYGWSEDLGWIAFGTADNAANGPVSENTSTGVVTGKAKILNDGTLIDFNASPYNSNVVVNTGTSAFSGYAWSTSLGWINFTGVSLSSPAYTGTITANQNLTLDTANGGSGSYYLGGGTYIANATTITVPGNFNIVSGATFTKGGTLTFNGTTIYTDSTATPQNIGTVVINGTSVTLASSMTVDSMTVTSGTLNLASAGYTLKLSGTGTPLSVAGTLNPGTNSIVQYVGTTTATNVATVPYHDLKFTPTGATAYNMTGSLTGANAMTGDLTIDANATLNTYVGTTSYDISCVNITTDATGKLDAGVNGSAGTSTFTLSGDWIHTNGASSGYFDYGKSTIILTNTGNINSYYGLFYNLNVAFAGKITTSQVADWGIEGVLTVGTGKLTGSGTITLNNNATVLSTPLVNYGANFDIPLLYSSTSSGTVNVAAGTYNKDVNFKANDPGATITYQLAGSTTVTGNTLIYNNFDTNTAKLNTNGSTYTVTNLTIGTTGQTARYSWLVTGNSTINVTGNLTVYPSDASGDNKIDATGTPTINVTGNFINNDTLIAGSSTVNFTKATGTQTLNSGGTAAANTFNNVTHSGAGTLQLLTNNINIDGNFTNSGGTFNTNSLDMTVAGNVDLTGGSFTQGTRTITLDGAATQLFTAGGTGAGHTPYNLTLANTSGVSAGVTFTDSLTLATGGRLTDTTQDSRVIFADGGTYTVPNITITGAAAHNILLQKGTGAVGHWHFVVAGTPSVSYATPSNSDATGSGAAITGGTDGGNNTNWDFGAAVPNAPTIGTPTVQSATSIRWAFTDTASNETGFKVYDGASTLKATCATADLTYCDETGMAVNTLFNDRYVVAYNANGNSTNSATAAAIYTLADTPVAPTVNQIYGQPTQLQLIVGVNTNPASTQFAISETQQSGGQFVQADGSLNTDAVWQTFAEWGSGAGTTITGLTAGTQYTFDVKARNGDNTETAFGTPGAQQTTPGAGNTVSGSLYDGIGGAKIGTAKTIHVSVNGNAAATTETSSGDYTVTANEPLDANDIITIFVSGETEKASTITKVSATGNLVGIDLFQNYTTIRHEGSIASIINTDLATADNVADTDILFSVDGSNVASYTQGLYIIATKTYAPGGDINVFGSYTNAGTFTSGTGTVTFNGTATGKTINPGSSSFYNLTFNGSGGAWSPLTNSINVTNDLTMTAGTFDTSNGTANVTVNGNVYGSAGIINMTATNTFTQNVAANKAFGTTSGSTAWTFNNLTFSAAGSSEVIITTSTGGTGDITVNSVLDISGACTEFNAGNRIYHLMGSDTPFTRSDSNFIASTSTFSFENATSATIIASYYYNLQTNPASGTPTYTLKNAATSFLAGTKIKTDHGTKNIEDFNIGDKVLSYNVNTNQPVMSEVTGTTRGNKDSYYIINGKIKATGNHVFILPDNSEKTVEDMKVGDTLKTYAGQEIIYDIQKINQTVPVYDIEVKDYHLFYAENYLVHNFGAGGCGVTSDSNITVNNDFTLTGAGSATVNADTYDPDTSVYGNFSIGSGQTFVASATAAFNVKGNWTNAGTFTHSNGTVTFNGTGAQTIDGTAATQTFYNFVVAKTAGQLLDVSGSTTTLAVTNFTETTGDFTAPATFNISGNLTLTSGTFTAGENTNIGGNWTNNGGNFTVGASTVTFNGTGAQAINGTAATQTFGRIIVAKTAGTLLSVSGSTTTLSTVYFTETTGDFTAPATFNIYDTLTLTTGTFTAGTNTYIGSYWAKATAATFVPGTNTVTFYAFAAVGGTILGTATTQTFYNLVIAKTPGTTVGVGGSTTTLEATNFTETTGNFNGPATFNIAGNVTLTAGTFTAGTNTNVSGNWTNNGGTFTPGNNTVTFNGTTTQTITGTTNTWYNLTINNTYATPDDDNDVDPDSAQTVTNTFTITHGQYSPVTGDSYKDVSINHAGSHAILKPDSGVTITVSGNWSRPASGVFTANGGTVIFNGTTTQTITGMTSTNAWYNLTIANTSATPSDTYDVDPSSAQTVTNTLLISDGQYSAYTGDSYKDVSITGTSPSINGRLVPKAGANITVSGNWDKGDTGTFTSGTGRVTFIGTTPSTLTGSTTFYDLTMNTTGIGNKTITFPTGSGNKQIISHTWSLDGDTSKVLTLRSASPNTAWYWDIPADFTAGDWINVQDSQTQTAYRITPGANTTDSGNNDPGWNFAPAAPTISTPIAVSTTAIEWHFTDTASNETGFKVYDSGDNLVATCATADLTYCTETGLSVNTQYTGRYVVAYNAMGNSPHSAAAASIYTLANTPLAPTLNNVAGNTDQLMMIITAGDSNPGGTTYALYETSTNKYVQADGSLDTSVIYQTAAIWGIKTVTGLSANTNYTFEAKAKNGDGVATISFGSTASKYTLIQVPTGISFGSVNDDSIVLSASGSLSNLTAGSSGLQFTETSGNPGAGGQGGFNPLWTNTNNATDTGLSLGIQYSYKVKARNGDGVQTTETSVYNQTTTTSGLTAPTTASLTVNSSTALTVGWTDNSTSETGFKVFVSTISNADCSLATYAGSPDYTTDAQIESQALTSLDTNTQYCIKVLATTGLVDSSPAYTTAPLYTFIETPSGISFDTVAANSIILSSANTPSNLTAGSSGLVFTETSGNPGGGGDVCFTNTIDNTCADTGLSINTQYSYKVKAKNGDGVVTDETIVLNKYTLANTPTAPTVIADYSETDGYFTDLTLHANGNPDGTQYKINTGDWQAQNDGATSKQTSLDCNQNYTYSVLARNGDLIETTNIEGMDTTPLCAPVGLIETNLTTVSVTLGWSAVEGTNSAYDISLGTDTAATNLGVTSNINDLNLTQESLDPATVYYYKVRAHNDNGTSAWSTVNKFTTTTITANPAAPVSSSTTTATTTTGEEGISCSEKPSAPSNLRATNIGSTNLSLAWDSSVAPCGLKTYDVFNANTGIKVGSVAKKSLDFINLGPNTSYKFFIIAIDIAGNTSLKSNILIIETLKGNEDVSNTGNVCHIGGGQVAFLILGNTPTEIAAGQTFPENVLVKVMVADGGGELCDDYRGLVYFTSTDSKADLTWNVGHSYSFTEQDAGQHEFNGSGFRLYSQGNQILTITDKQVSGQAEIKVIAGGVIFQKAQETVTNFFNHNSMKVNTAVVATTTVLLLTPVLVNVVIGLSNFLPQIIYWFTLMLLLIGIRKKRKTWGVVFNSQTGQPVSLAMVRIFDKEHKRLLESVITDKKGRFGLLVRPGTFYLVVYKTGFKFPSQFRVSEFFENIYTSGNIHIDPKTDRTVVLNIPLDPEAKASVVFSFWVIIVKFNRFLQKICVPIMVIGLIFAIIMVISSYHLIYVLSLILYAFFLVLEVFRSKKSRPYGVVNDVFGNPLETAVVRIFSKRSNRQIATDVTDTQGRFKFLVDPGIYYLMTAKPGYMDFKSHIIYLENEKTKVTTNIKLKKSEKQSPGKIRNW